MFTSKTLAKHICDNFIRKLPDDNVESVLTTMLENFKNSEINKYINNKNVEDYNKINSKKPVPKKEESGIARVQVWTRNN